MDKMAKPALLVLVLLIVISFLFLIHPKKKKSRPQFILKNLPFEAILKKVCIKGIDENNLPWKLTAKEVLAKEKFTDIYLKYPVLIKMSEDNSSILIKAVTGFYDKKLGKIVLEKDVTGNYKDIHIKGKFMQFNLKDNTVYFKNKIIMTNREVVLKGNNAVLNLNTHTFKITGDVEVNIL